LYRLTSVGLLAAISQKYARRYKCSIDTLYFEFEIENRLLDENEIEIDDLFVLNGKNDFSLINDREGLIICGFYMDGAKWSVQECRLIDSSQRFSIMPHIRCKLIISVG
jgi:hypothetical protein